MQNIPSLTSLVHELGRLPGVGPKTAQRLAYHILRAPTDYVQALRDALKHVKEKIRECPICFAFTEDEIACFYCSHPERTKEIICVVEEPLDIERIESSAVFRGRYHVLHGAIAPLDGIGPDDLKIPALLDRLNGVKEVIFALDADLEGDTTVLYLAKILRELGVATSRIAHGVPIGGDIDYVDFRTLGRAIENRVQV